MRRSAIVGALVANALVLAHGGAWSDDARIVVATVGDTEITADDLTKRLNELPKFQLRTFGDTPQTIRKKFLEDVMIPAALHARAAREEQLDRRPLVQNRIRDVLRQAMETELREARKRDAPITDGEVKKYYDENRSKFHTPRRLRLWRILVEDQDLAKKIIATVKAAPGDQGPKKWTELARKHSVDNATKMRDGNLGFVRPDGSTNMPRVRVDSALFDAAEKVKDGEVVPEPVAEGDRWAVVWRRGGLAAVTRTFEQEESSIRQILARKKLEESMKQLLTRLRKDHVTEVNDELLRYVDVANAGQVSSRPKPGTLPRRPPRGKPTPHPGERGNR